MITIPRLFISFIMFVSAAMASSRAVRYDFVDCSGNNLFETSMAKAMDDDMQYGKDRYFTFKVSLTPRMVKITVEARDIDCFEPHSDDIGYTMFNDRFVIMRNMETLDVLGLTRSDSTSREIHYSDVPAKECNTKDWIFVYRENQLIMEWYCNVPVILPIVLNDSIAAAKEIPNELVELIIPKVEPEIYNLFNVDERPLFPGEEENHDAFRLWIKENIRFPEEARKHGIEKKHMSFFIIIKKDGTAQLPHISEESIKEYKPDFLNEIYRLIEIMPKWTPAKKNGEAVNIVIAMNLLFTNEPEQAQ